jgi:hypothetical protein
VGGHQHDGQAWLGFVKSLHEFQAAESRQAEVSQHHITLVIVGAAQTLIAAMAYGDFEAVLLKNVAQIRGQAGVVLDEQNVGVFGHERGYRGEIISSRTM